MRARNISFVTVMLLSTYICRGEPIASFPAPTTLENIAVSSAGELFVSSINNGTVYRVSSSGSSNVFGQVSGRLNGVGLDLDGTVVAAGGSNFYRFAADGTPSLVTAISGAQFLNGLTLFSSRTFLVADSSAATIWQVDLNSGNARAWLTGNALAAPAGAGSTVGANGIKIFNGAAYISNTAAQTIVRVPILSDGSAGTPQVYASGISVDDFAIGSDGSIFAATQGGNSVVRLRPDGTRTVLATTADGLLGDAAVAFGRSAADAQSIYVVNNGGAFQNLPGGPQPGTIVRLSVEVSGVIPETQAVPEPSMGLLTGSGLVLAALLTLQCRARCNSRIDGKRSCKIQSV